MCEPTSYEEHAVTINQATATLLLFLYLKTLCAPVFTDFLKVPLQRRKLFIEEDTQYIYPCPRWNIHPCWKIRP